MTAVQFSCLAENKRILLCNSSNDTLEGYVARKVARTRTGTLGRMVMSRANARIRRDAHEGEDCGCGRRRVKEELTMRKGKRPAGDIHTNPSATEADSMPRETCMRT